MNKDLKNIMRLYDYKENHTQLCGPGSTLWYTAPLRTQLPIILKKYNITSMIDAPCGDYSWMKLIDLDQVKYTGADINESLVIENKRKFPDKEFRLLDITEDEIPTVDLVFVRDCLFHLNNELKRKFLKNFLRSKSKYLLTSNHPRNVINDEMSHITGGDFKQINWCKPPWNFPNPLDSIIDYNVDDNKFLSHPYRTMELWSHEQLKEL